MPQAAIQAEGLVKHFKEVRALDGVDLEVQEGSVVGLLGPNGAGKTTAVRVLTTLLTPDSGRASVSGFDVLAQPASVRSVIGLTGQYAAVDELLSGRENLSMIGRLLGLGQKESRRRADALLEQFDLSDAAVKIVKTYSGGMRRRLDLAASLIGRPRILFLDEPTTGLDPRSRLQVWDLIRTLVADGATVLLTTQYLEEADELAHSIVVMDRGRVVASGTADELKEKVGGQVIEVRTKRTEDLTVAAELLKKLASAEPTIDPGTNVISVPVADPDLLGTAFRRFDKKGIVVLDFALRRPSLDEVFLALTGHKAEEDGR